MVTPQQSADLALRQWQALRALSPDDRIEALMANFFREIPPCDVEYDAIMRRVSAEMELA